MARSPAGRSRTVRAEPSLRAIGGWEVVGALAVADARIANSRDLAKVHAHREALLAAHAAELELNAIGGRVLGLVLAEVAVDHLAVLIERSEVIADQLEREAAGALPNDDRLDVAGRVLAASRYSAAQVVRALHPEHAGASARGLPPGKKRRAERQANQAAAELDRLRERLEAVHARASRARRRRRAPQTGAERASEHILSVSVQSLADQLAQVEGAIDAIAHARAMARRERSSSRIAARIDEVKRRRAKGSSG